MLQKDFTCEITGHSNLTFFEAYESEVCLSSSSNSKLFYGGVGHKQNKSLGRPHHLRIFRFQSILAPETDSSFFFPTSLQLSVDGADITQTASYRQLDIIFPEPLREPILKRVQFSIIGRLEHLGQYNNLQNSRNRTTNI